MFWVRNSGAEPFSTEPVRPLHPAITSMVVGADGKPLTRIVTSRVLIVDPSRLPIWALRELHRRFPGAMASKSQILWNGHSPFYQQALHWNISGLYPVHTRVVVPIKGVSTEWITVIARQHGAWARHAWVWNQHGAFEPSLQTVHVTLSASLMKTLSPWLPSGSSVIVINGRGQILAQLANPGDRRLSWQPHPVGEILTPVLLATAIQHPQLFAKLSPTQPNLLSVISARWGQSSIRRTLRTLGFGKGTAISGQPFPDPPLSEGNVKVFTQGTNLWATLDQVARGYLVLADRGHEPYLSLNPRVSNKASKPLTTRGAVSEVEKVLPQELVNNIRFSVWRPGNHLAVAYTQANGGIVTVIQGPATAHTLSIVQQVALWAHNK